jgi:hypothetical protein
MSKVPMRGNPFVEGKVYTFHSPFNGGKKTSRVTLAVKRENDQLLIAAARCSKKDTFNRKTGRVKANERLENKQYLQQIPIHKETPVSMMYEFMMRLCKQIINKDISVKNVEMV